jgi:hypothetical protein
MPIEICFSRFGSSRPMGTLVDTATRLPAGVLPT